MTATTSTLPSRWGSSGSSNVNTLYLDSLFPERKPAVPIKHRGFAARLSFDPFREICELPSPALARIGRVQREAGSKLL